MANIIFDFDGTLADSFEVSLGIFRGLTRRSPQLDKTEIERLRGLTHLMVIRELKIPAWKVPFMLLVGRRRMTKLMQGIHTFPGMEKTVRQLHENGHKLFIISSNSSRNIRLFLDVHKMNSYFMQVYGVLGLRQKSGALKKLIKYQHLMTSESWYVGDEVRDIAAARGAGIKVVSVTWGYNTIDVLADHQPDRMVNQPAELLKIFRRAGKD